MSRLGQIRVEARERGLGPPAPRRAFGLAVMIVCAAASFTAGLVR